MHLKTDGYTVTPVMTGGSTRSGPYGGSGQHGKGVVSTIASLLGLGKKKRQPRAQKGKGFFGDLGRAIGGVGGGALGSMVGLPGLGSAAGGAIGGAIPKLFGGKRRAKRQNGKGLVDILKKVHKVVKDNQLISKGIGAVGYGRKRRTKRK